MNVTTLVTGATGFAGGHLLTRLMGETQLVAWFRPGGTPPDLEKRVEWQAVDLLDRAAVLAALDQSGAERIYHLAGAPQVDTSWKTIIPHLKANVLGTHHLLDAARRLGAPRRILVVSSAQIYQPSDEPLDEDAPLLPASPYGLSKLAEDELARRAAAEDGLEIAIARPFNHAGPGQSPAFVISSFARQIARIEAGLAPPEILVGNLETRRDITDVRDVVDAYVRIMETAPAGRPYNICSGRAWRIGDLLDELIHLADVKVRIEVDQHRLRPSDSLISQGDASRIRMEIGWVPSIPVEQTVRDTLQWWRQRIASDASA